MELLGHDGQEGLEVIEREKPDLVLLDMMLPVVAGDQVLKRMRESEWGKETRVYIISNLNEEDAPAGLHKYNIEGYAVKANLQNDDLDRLVDKILTPKDQDSIVLDSGLPD